MINPVLIRFSYSIFSVITFPIKKSLTRKNTKSFAVVRYKVFNNMGITDVSPYSGSTSITIA